MVFLALRDQSKVKSFGRLTVNTAGEVVQVYACTSDTFLYLILSLSLFNALQQG